VRLCATGAYDPQNNVAVCADGILDRRLAVYRKMIAISVCARTGDDCAGELLEYEEDPVFCDAATKEETNDLLSTTTEMRSAVLDSHRWCGTAAWASIDLWAAAWEETQLAGVIEARVYRGGIPRILMKLRKESEAICLSGARLCLELASSLLS